MARLGPDGTGGKQLWLLSGYLNDLSGLPQKLAMTAKFIDNRILPQTGPEQVQELTTNIAVIAHKINLLVEARKSIQDGPMDLQLQEDFRSWRRALGALFHRWAENPTAGPAEDLKESLAKIETRCVKAFSVSGEGKVSEEAWENHYRLLGAYRAVSQAVVDYSGSAGVIEWTQWSEDRF